MSGKATATVTFTLEVQNVGTWSGNPQLAQFFAQATDMAIGRLKAGLRDTDFRIVGEPKVHAVIVKAERAP